MASSQPRLTAVVERPLYQVIESLAKRDHVTLSQKVRDLLIGALGLMEDAELEATVEARRKVSKKSYSLAETKKRFAIR
jgi:hypothetical protein